MTLTFLALVTGLLMTPDLASAQGVFGPKLVPYSGQIEQDGLKADGTRSLRFSLYTAVADGDEIWTEIHDNVAISQGQFNVKLGSSEALEAHVWVRESLYLEIAVCPGAACADQAAADEATLTRQRMLAVPYARHAANGNPPGSIIAYSVNAAPPGWLMCDGSAIPNDARHAALRALVGPNTPDFRNYFLRGATAGRAFGSEQSDSYRAHNHARGTLGGTATSAGSHIHNFTRKPHPNHEAGGACWWSRRDMGDEAIARNYGAFGCT